MKNLMIALVGLFAVSCIESGDHIPFLDYPDASWGQDGEMIDTQTSSDEGLNGMGGAVEPDPPPIFGVKESPPGRGSVLLPSWSDRHPRPRQEDDGFVVEYGADAGNSGGVDVVDPIDASDGEDQIDDLNDGEEVYNPPPPPNCDDENACTDDSYDPAMGCVNDDVACDDGDPCTLDMCDPATGECIAAEFSCDDTNPCTADACVDGTCRHLPAAGSCDDGSFCTTGDACVDGACKGTAVQCDDGNPCTTDYCSYTSGCVLTPTTGPCNDGNPCTTDDHCDGGLCVSTPGVCEDGNPCTDDVCETAGCTSIPVDCNDDDPCTVDACNPEAGCTNEQSDELCPPSPPPSCDDGNPCTIDAYDPATGCMYTQKAPHPWMPICKPCTVSSDCEPIYGLESLSGQCIGGACSYKANPGFGWVCKPSLVDGKQALWRVDGEVTAAPSPVTGDVPADINSFNLILTGETSCFDPNSFCLCKEATGWVFAGTFAGGFGAAPCPEVSSMGCMEP